MDESIEQKSIKWKWFGEDYPRKEIVFFAQIVVIYAVIIVSILNLTFNTGDKNLWIVLSSSCLGYLLPSPSLEKDGAILRNTPQ